MSGLAQATAHADIPTSIYCAPSRGRERQRRSSRARASVEQPRPKALRHHSCQPGQWAVARAGRRFQRAARPLDGQRVELLDHSPRGIVSDLGEDGVVARPARARVRGPGSGSGFGGSGSGSRIGASPRWSVVGDLGPRARGGISGFARLGAHQCVAGQLPTAHEREAVYMKRSGPALPPAQPTIPLLMIGPWQPQFGSCFGQARFPSGTTPAGQSPLTTRGGAAPLPPQLIRPCTRKSFSERYSSPPHWWVAANLGRRSRSAGGWHYSPAPKGWSHCVASPTEAQGLL